MRSMRNRTFGQRLSSMWRSRPIEPGLDLSDVLLAAGFLATGLVVGGGLALLLAPKSGHDTRLDVATQVRKLQSSLRSRPSTAAGPTGDNHDPGTKNLESRHLDV